MAIFCLFLHHTEKPACEFFLGFFSFFDGFFFLVRKRIFLFLIFYFLEMIELIKSLTGNTFSGVIVKRVFEMIFYLSGGSGTLLAQ
ncbi:hypothetical protein BREVNS_0834 [Brevinematales bacterium NS]|jgi:hypothetical protein|nr:hypothetical protein BREVNS_0834 [Brevinematales bacterium NS]